jgi:hypothetical protein
VIPDGRSAPHRRTAFGFGLQMVREESLIEVPRCRQIPDEPRRRWFCSRTLDLIVWYSEDDRIVGFQLCYDDGTDRHSLTWTEDCGYRHHRIDEGEGKPGRHKMTPILIPDGIFDKDRVLTLFDAHSQAIDSQIKETVRQRLLEYSQP